MSDEDAGSHNAKPSTTSSPTMSWWRQMGGKRLPPWLDHFNSHDLKTFFRCWVATWVAMLLIFIHPVLTNFGQAAFFAALVTILVPPASILLLYAFAAFTLLLGMCMAWAWGLLVMKAAFAARPGSETAGLLQALKQAAADKAKSTGVDPQWEAQILVHDGFLLDARITAVTFSLGLVFIYVVSRLRSVNPKLLLFQLFGSIVMDLFILFAPGLPGFEADLASVLMKPGAAGVAIGLTCCLLFFPQSASFDALMRLERLLRLLNTSVTSTLSRLRREEIQAEDLKAHRVRMITLYKSIDPVIAFLPLDISRGRWNETDVKGLHGQIRDVMVSALSLIDFHIALLAMKTKEARLETLAGANSASGEEESSEKQQQLPLGHHQLQASADLMYALRDPELGVMHDRAFDALREPTSQALHECSHAFDLAARCVNTVNRCRWIHKPAEETFESLTRELEGTLETLETVTDDCVVNTTEGVVGSYADVFDENGDLKEPGMLGPPSFRGLMFAMILEERILSLARNSQGLLQYILRLKRERKTHKIWAPSRLRYFFTWVIHGKMAGEAYSPTAGDSNSGSNDVSQGDDKSELEEQFDQSKEAYRRLHISRGYAGRAKRRSGPSRAVASTWTWLFNAHGMFALRFVLATLVTAIPAVIPHSSGFFYREKGIWAVISAQTSCSLLMADFTFSTICRIVGTVAGGVLGMLAWYMGSGDGPGNPYGLGATSAVFLIPLIWVRVFAPPEYTKATLLSGVTFLLVVGFSYDHDHIVQYGLPGKGYEAFWKRLTCVFIGILAAAIVHVFPSLPSATKHISQTLANSVSTLSDHYALLLSHWGARSTSSPLGAVAEDISLGVAEKLLSLEPMIAQLPLEFSLSNFDQKVLRETSEQIQNMNQSLRRLLNLSTSLPQELQERLARTAGLLDSGIIGQIMAVLDIVEQSLRTGSPLPERLPTPLVVRFYESWDRQKRQAMLSVSLVRDENYRRYCVAMSSYIKFLGSIDDVVIVLKETLGECHVIHKWEDV